MSTKDNNAPINIEGLINGRIILKVVFSNDVFNVKLASTIFFGNLRIPEFIELKPIALNLAIYAIIKENILPTIKKFSNKGIFCKELKT